VRAYQEACAAVIHHYEGHIAQYLGDGLLVYFGYPAAHEDDAQRAVRAGLEIIATLQHQVPSPLAGEGQGEGAKGSRVAALMTQSLQVRIGIHTGLVVVGEMGRGAKREQLALGDTPNIAARVQGLAEPDTVVISQATYRLIHGYFTCQDQGSHLLKGISTPVEVYKVLAESGLQSRFEVAATGGLTPLVGREQEVGLLVDRWERAKEGAGQVVLLSGEPGIGKSRLVQELKEQLEHEGVTRIEFRCSPYHQNSTLYPVIEHLQRVLGIARDDSAQIKLGKLEQTLSHYRFPQADTLPLLAALLSLPHPESVPPLTLSPERQKEKTLQALVKWLFEEAERHAVYCAWEDLHWADPSTLELLDLYLGQVPTARMLALLTFRPGFMPPWGSRSYLSQLTLGRLGRSQVERLVANVTGGRTLPDAVVEQVVAKTDGVPLFVEELTKMVIELGLVRAVNGHYELTRPLSALAIPATLHDSLMARLDRLAEAKGVAQLGAALGREFSYELLHAVSSVDGATLQRGLARLVDAELVYQRGLPPHAHYVFKHALVQDAAYQSLLKSRRQQYHSQIAQVLEERFAGTKETQPELLAHHYTEAGLIPQAIPYWQRAGQRAAERSAYVEAISHLTRGVTLLQTLPDTPERSQQEFTLQTSLGASLQAARGQAHPEVERAYARAREICQAVGATPQLFPVLWGLLRFYFARADLQTAHELAEQLLHLAQKTPDPALLMEAHRGLASTWFMFGEIASARKHFEQGIALYDPQQHSAHAFLYGQDPGVVCLSYMAWALWLLGYPDQALKKTHEALLLARELSHPLSLALALHYAGIVHQLRREGQLTQKQQEASIEICTEQGFPFWLTQGTIVRGWALAEQGQKLAEGVSQMCQGLAAQRAIGVGIGRTWFLALLVEGYGKGEQVEEGLTVLTEAFALVLRTGERFYEAELYRLKGELTLQQSRVPRPESRVTNPQHSMPNTQHLTLNTQAETEAEGYFQKAIEIARKQQAKSLELRAVMSLARLWQQQGKKEEARQRLAEIYNWFTEGFDTMDLQEARALLEQLS
jgi:class 3 adenylate cyclase/predicted ATPase